MRRQPGISLYKTATGELRYRAVVDVPSRSGEQRKQLRRSFKTLEEAISFREATRVQVRDRAFVSPDRITVSELVEAFLQSKRTNPEIRQNTVQGYETWAKRVTKDLGLVQAQGLTRSTVREHVQKWGVQRSKRTVAGYMWILSSSLQLAVEDGILKQNVATNIASRGTRATPRKVMSEEEWDRFVAVVEGEAYAGAWWLTLYGLRRSELLALTWSDVNFKARQVHIQRSRVALDGGATQIGAPKTRRGLRTIVLPEHVFAALTKLRNLHLESYGLKHIRTGYLVVDEAGQPMRPERWSDAFKALAEEAGIEGVTLHSARHSAVTRMRSHGAKDHAVAQFLGHDEVVMRNTYTHADFDGIVEAGELLLGPKSDVTSVSHGDSN